MRWLWLILVPSIALAKVAGPLYTHTEREQKEFEHLYKGVNVAPAIFLSAGAPSSTPLKIGDINVSTTTGKVYIATATATSASWAVLN